MSTSQTQGGAAAFLNAVENRRTAYAINNESPIPDARVQEIVEFAVKHCPSSFNSQTTRAVVAFGGSHTKLWDIAKEKIRAIVSDDAWDASEKRLNGFQGGHGTVLLYEDQEAVRQLQEKIPLYAEHFPTWSEHTHGIHAYTIWTALTAEGLGCSLQHYNPLIDEDVAEAFDVPMSWKLRGQLVFGKPTAAPAEKTFQPLEQRVKVVN
ncbi:hypothetical protein JCM8202_002615 [Rhodotorula sphaerocarpa]